MQHYKILTLVGKDRPGIVDDLSTLLERRQAHMEDSRMAALGGCFSVMALISYLPEQLDGIRKDLELVQAKGFAVSLHDARPLFTDAVPAASVLKMEVRSMDHPGGVQKIVHLLHTREVNIVSLDTRARHAPVSGAPLFDLHLEGHVPSTVSVSGIRADLLALARKLDLELRFGE